MITEADTCRKYVIPKIMSAGWKDEQISEQKTFTNGKIIVTSRGVFRKERKRADYLLKYTYDVPIAVIEAKAAYKKAIDGMEQAKEYAEILDLKFAYSTNGLEIEEYDFIRGKQRTLTDFPSPEELWERLSLTENFNSENSEIYLQPLNRDLRNPDRTIKLSRYYQDISINRAIKAVINNKKRILITMATGTGKTFVAFQIIWKLWKTKTKKKILFLADRDVLIEQAKDKTFTPFGDAVFRIEKRTISKSRDIYFSLYQAMAGDREREGLYKKYPRDFFDLIVIDECHRGSVSEQSSWRKILDWFSSAVQIGLTATPKRDESADTYEYYGNPVYTYSLKDGIEDGFLAPYRVYRVITDVDASGWIPKKNQVDRYKNLIPEKLYQTKDFGRIIAMRSRNETIAHHLTNFMKEHGRWNKTIIFCVDQEEAGHMTKIINNLNSDLNETHYCVRITSNEGDLGKKFLSKFQDSSEKIPVVVTTSKLLTTGVDVPNVRNIVIFKPIESMVEFKQIIGRGTRLSEEQNKYFFNIIDYTGSATRLFADPDFDGTPELIAETEIDAEGDVLNITEIKSEIDLNDKSGAYSLQNDSEGEIKKFYVDDQPVSVIYEYVSNLDTNGSKLTVVEFIDKSREKIKKLISDPTELKNIWINQESREELLNHLQNEGISLQELIEATQQDDADPFDLIIHLAFNKPIKTRKERASYVKKKYKRFFNEFDTKAREIIEIILHKYCEFGIQEVTPHILEIPEIEFYGKPIEIAENYFGGIDNFHNSLSELQKLIYSES
ncbi:MAG: EcoAI/FtnUII family type I restriction enzme subunit R [Methanobacterium formicicum]